MMWSIQRKGRIIRQEGCMGYFIDLYTVSHDYSGKNTDAPARLHKVFLLPVYLLKPSPWSTKKILTGHPKHFNSWWYEYYQYKIISLR